MISKTYINADVQINGDTKVKQEYEVLEKLALKLNQQNKNDVVNAEYVIKILAINEVDAENLRRTMEFPVCKMYELEETIEKWKLSDKVFRAVTDSAEMDKLHQIEVDLTRGWTRILQVENWGEKGGVYVKKITLECERLTRIAIRIKYLKGTEYICSEAINIKMSDLMFEYEDGSVLQASKKMKILIDYMPLEKQVIDYRKVFVALCRYHDKVKGEVIASDKLGLEETYTLIVEKAFNLLKGNVSAIEKDFYILSSKELGDVAKKAGYANCRELAKELSTNHLLVTDTDKISRRQKTMRRDGKNGKYYCILTSEQYKENVDKIECDFFDLPQEDMMELDTLYETLKEPIKKIDKPKNSNAVVAYNGGTV